MDDTTKGELGEMEKKVNVIEAKLDRLINLFEANNRVTSGTLTKRCPATRLY